MPAHVRQRHIKQHQLHRGVRHHKHLECLRARHRGDDVVAGGVEQVLQDGQVDGVVVHNEDLGAHLRGMGDGGQEAVSQGIIHIYSLEIV